MALTFSIDDYNVLTVGENEFFIESVDGQLSSFAHGMGRGCLSRVAAGALSRPSFVATANWCWSPKTLPTRDRSGCGGRCAPDERQSAGFSMAATD
jgi:hypothetical protein